MAAPSAAVRIKGLSFYPRTVEAPVHRASRRREHQDRARAFLHVYSTLDTLSGCRLDPLGGARFGQLDHCSSRVCPSDGITKAKHQGEVIIKKVREMNTKTLVLFTFTIQDLAGLPLKGAWWRFTEVFTFFSDKFIGTVLDGWVVVKEENEHSDRWHPHVHMLGCLKHDLGEADEKRLFAVVKEKWNSAAAELDIFVGTKGVDTKRVIPGTWEKTIAYTVKCPTAFPTKTRKGTARTPADLLQDCYQYRRLEDISRWQEWEQGRQARPIVYGGEMLAPAQRQPTEEDWIRLIRACGIDPEDAWFWWEDHPVLSTTTPIPSDRRCRVCRHERRDDIERAIRNKERTETTVTSIAKMFGVSRGSVDNHARHAQLEFS